MGHPARVDPPHPEGTAERTIELLMSKIFNLRLDAGLFVLSACETALERIARLPRPPVLVTQHLAGRRGNTPLDLWRWQAATASRRIRRSAPPPSVPVCTRLPLRHRLLPGTDRNWSGARHSPGTPSYRDNAVIESRSWPAAGFPKTRPTINDRAV
jgi:hypothetical protein